MHGNRKLKVKQSILIFIRLFSLLQGGACLLLKIAFTFGKLEVTDNLDLIFNGTPLHPQSRKLNDLAKVLMDPTITDGRSGDTILYKMYREAILDKHYDLFTKNILRFDITIMAPIVLGEELNKTLGHSHPEAAAGLSYPEIYQVLYGNACFLLQKLEKGKLIEFKVIEADAGDAVVIPPNYGHVSVNRGDMPLVLANLVSGNFTPIYGDYLSKRGAAYYMLKGNRMVPNPSYGSPPLPIFSKERYPISNDLYTDFISDPRSYAFLNDPTKLGKATFVDNR